MACRLVCGLGGHIHHPTEPYGADTSRAERQAYHVRVLFWLCYMFDKDISLRCGYPPILTGDHCDLTPLRHSHTIRYNYLLGAVDSMMVENGPFDPREFHWDLPTDPMLSCLKEKTCRLLYSPEARRATDSQLLCRVRQLDDDLEGWRRSLPAAFRPKLFVPSDTTQLPVSTEMATTPRRVRQINLQLEYHSLLTVIHTTVRRCGADTPEASTIPEHLHSVIHSSIDLALEASRSTLRFLKTNISSVADEAFWLVSLISPFTCISLYFTTFISESSTGINGPREKAHLLLSCYGRLLTIHQYCHSSSRHRGTSRPRIDCISREHNSRYTHTCTNFLRA